MPTRQTPIRSFFAAAGCAAFLGLLSGAAQSATPPPIRVAPQGIEYMCGGANREEAAFMRMVSPRWSTTLEFAVARGQSGGVPVPVQVKVRDSYNGDLAMESQATGPLMLARLEPGVYDVEAMVGGITVTQHVTVMRGAAAKALFLFPSNVDFAALTQPSHTTAALGQ